MTQDDSNEGQCNDNYVTKLQDYDSVTTLYYHDVRIHSNGQDKCKTMCNLNMTLNGKESCQNQCKIDTGVEGSLLPVSMFKQLGGNMTELRETIDTSVRLVAYNDTEIRQYGVLYRFAVQN